MRVVVYEHITATQADDGSSMYREGRAMRDALTADLQKIAGVEVVATGGESAIVIAPETGGILEECVARFRKTHAVLASSAEALALTRDKLALAMHWHEHGVRTPATMDAQDWPSTRVPVVLKPRDGAGSCESYLCEDAATFRERFLANPESSRIAQAYIPGLPASVSFVMSDTESVPLPPMLQHLSTDGLFQYRGGETLHDPDLAERATAIATQAIACVPGLLGYIGVDLILGDATDGTRDYAIEINPRLTTSYVGLRAAVDGNIAEMMLFPGQRTSNAIRLGTVKRVRFTADGVIG
jgi:tyramine---L-glutamate ligase